MWWIKEVYISKKTKKKKKKPRFVRFDRTKDQEAYESAPTNKMTIDL